ncbi:hypothetical protein NPA31_007065 [Aurantimonas sp. MSK8Z-1]|uniref:hypothetical protein n=1 Tax=Mangrovibrevibacter kandeliae TaxID=2968473 RepID=UPI0021199CCD|nr:hypothetical protein [Aurantimonas sp. MSK8Z-1]MCW4114721.1 hypothetical protein [Aurantimonas sp. MSK8Z-1]
MAENTVLDTTPTQMSLDLTIAVEREVDGVGMGVLGDGTPFLTLRGLARMCGVDHAGIIRMSSTWGDNPQRTREQKIRELITAQGFDPTVFFHAVFKSGIVQHAVPAQVCMAVLEYYAFEASSESQHALRSYRTLAKKGFTDFVYAQVGWNPDGKVSLAWKQFHDRVSLVAHAVPMGYFSVYQEIAGMIVPMINAGIDVGPHIVPDISVGQRWGRHWTAESLEVLFGPRKPFEHDYPVYFPQAASNPQKPWCYPDEALGEFRKWFRKTYLEVHLPQYLNNQAKVGKVQTVVATKAINAFRSVSIAAKP